MLDLCVWLNRHVDSERAIRVYVNGHPHSGVKLWLERSRRRRGSLGIVVRMRAEIETKPLQSRKKLEETAAEAVASYGLDITKPHWFKLLCVVEWPYRYDRNGILAEFRSRLRKKGDKRPSGKKRVARPEGDDEIVLPPPKRRRTIIRD